MSLIAELKRRNVFRVGAAYAIVAWLLVEVASVFLPALRLPEWTLTLLVFLVVVGFPLALIFAWAFELTPEGIKRETDVDPAESITKQTGRKLDFIIIGVLAVGIIYFAVDKFVLKTDQVPAEEAFERKKSIAVLPFDNISPDPEDAYFADGIHDEILAQLSKIRDLKVISRTSVMRYRGEDRLSSPEIAAALGVANLLEGSVRLAGNRVRITTQLIEAESDAHLWTETYDRDLTAANIFSIQSNVANSVADALRATLSPEEEDRFAIRPTKNTDAYLAYLIGKQRLAKGSSVALAEAVEYFQQAIELDPSFALAHVELARSYKLQVSWFGLPRDEAYAKAEALIERALELDDRLGEAYAARVQDWSDFEKAQGEYRRALELNPNSAMTYLFYGFLMQSWGRSDEALALHRKGVELDPLSGVMINAVGQDLDALGRFDEGLSWYERSFEVDPGYSNNLHVVGLHHWLISGEYGEAVRWFGKNISADPGDVWTPAHLGRLFMDLGDPDRAERWIHRSIELSPESFVSNQAMFLLYVYRGNEAAGLEYGRKAFEIPQGWFLQVHPVELLGDHELRLGRYLEALALYEEIHPELLNENEPRVNNWNYRVAIDLASVFYETGELDRADLLLKLSSQHIKTLARLGFAWAGYGITDVQIYALQGEKQKALLALRQAIDEGWRGLWWYLLKHDPNLESLHDEPEYQAIIAEIEADMAAQLARVREMEKSGELEPIPELAVE